MQIKIQDEIIDELKQEKTSSTSSSLQRRCKLLYTLALSLNYPKIANDQNIEVHNQNLKRVTELVVDIFTYD
jgi:hypothetical protein